ncbi:Asp-tRNA(Asn)/Glu-tRNA(Gln) amidotransferase GatCAB subunit A [Candidatus Roizmanbacteria bacterium CG_4_10_14_0_2_um_filter_36_9]|uniref:Glutamyl-tRNA(Gln) amidotransferase subunit A n=1 Tax=Candidatus Roizmanbacteria bacterium CG_4_10_14_0_2_um_filter_36_9 TaxID=1974823 RepID=A0A2M7U2P7_9BACT|nr:MAG: Asp-tRNA(Asn)/Glu-tRNA(Gln) amidotransferase GatCAB subunit A [Candidatus Roizmanbacteria bacterium CG_4_10_14_0_2_um_filter_36_9]
MDLFGKTVTQLRDLIKNKKVSSTEVWDYFAKRSKKYNKDLNVFLAMPEMEPDAEKGELSGIPLAVKDNFCTKGVKTTASSHVLENFIPPYESTVTLKLKKAGSRLLGKTNMDAWAHGSSTETSDFGPTKNPWDTMRTPGGSSGGSTAAVAAYLAPAAIGSETAGSIRQPASWCGVVGLKPTYGRVSRYGVIAMGSSFDCPGPITQSVEDAALLLQRITGKDPYDATSSDVPVPNYTFEMKKKRKFTIGVPKEYMKDLDPEVEKKVREAISEFEKMGHTVKEVSLLDPKYSISVYTILQRAEVSSNLGRYDGVRFGTNRDIFGKEAKKRIMLGTYALSVGYYDAYYKKAQQIKTLIIKDLKRVFSEVDLIMAAPTPTTAIKLGEFEKYAFFGETMDKLNEAAAVAGTPAISIPCGLDSNGLPVGLQIMGNYFDEGTILSAAHQFEKETNFFDVIKIGREKYRD